MRNFLLKKHAAPFAYSDFFTHGPNKAVIFEPKDQQNAVEFLLKNGIFCELEFRGYDGQRMACDASFFEFTNDDALTPKLLAKFDYAGSINDGKKNIAPTLYDVLFCLSLQLTLDDHINDAADCYGVCCDVNNFAQARKEVENFEKYHAESMAIQANFKAYWGEKYAQNVELLAETFN